MQKYIIYINIIKNTKLYIVVYVYIKKKLFNFHLNQNIDPRIRIYN